MKKLGCDVGEAVDDDRGLELLSAIRWEVDLVLPDLGSRCNVDDRGRVPVGSKDLPS